MPRSLVATLTPQGALRLERGESEPGVEDGLAAGLEAAFVHGAGPGLLRLGFAPAGGTLPPDLGFWRSFALRFLAARCRAEVAPEFDADLARLVEDAPPMRGGEYLDASALAALWRQLGRAFEAELAASGLDLDGFLAAHDSRWRHVGRVHFNLAENRKDAERPFAFLATYVPGVAAHGALRHAPLGAALREYAGAGARRNCSDCWSR
jgi:hypothetical protein